jgi:PAS domain S-box-containing protein
MKDPQGSPIGFATISQDITRQKRAQEELQEKSQRLEKLSTEFQGIVDMSPLGVIAFDLDRNVWSWSSAAERILGWKADEIIGRRLPVPESARAQWTELEKALRGGQFFTNVESKRVRRDGSEFDALISGAPLYDSQGRVTGFIKMIADATEMVHARETLKQAEKLAAMGRLAATIAHEINNPLEAVMNLVYLARSSSHEDTVRQMLSSAEEEHSASIATARGRCAANSHNWWTMSSSCTKSISNSGVSGYCANTAPTRRSWLRREKSAKSSPTCFPTPAMRWPKADCCA